MFINFVEFICVSLIILSGRYLVDFSKVLMIVVDQIRYATMYCFYLSYIDGNDQLKYVPLKEPFRCHLLREIHDIVHSDPVTIDFFSFTLLASSRKKSEGRIESRRIFV